MSKTRKAFDEVMGELRERIRNHTVTKLHRKPPPHDEPDGDEDAEGNEYPGSPDDMTPVENEAAEQVEYDDKHGVKECETCGGPLSNGRCENCG